MSYIEIDTKALAHNYNLLKSVVAPEVAVGAAVKADGYGTGASMATKLFHKNGCRHFFVHNVTEALQIRETLGPNEGSIFTLGGFEIENYNLYKKFAITPIVVSLDQLRYMAKNKIDIEYALKFNTGMTRLGLEPLEVKDALPLIESMGNNKLTLVMSHNACAEFPEHPQNKIQLEIFQRIAQHFPNTKKSLAQSGSIFLGKEYHYDVVRPGIFLYGAEEPTIAINHRLKAQPVVSVYGEIIHKKVVNNACHIGYNATHKVDAGSKIFTVRFGYADGYLRSLNTKGKVFSEGKMLPVVGRINMDMITIDASSLDESAFSKAKYVEILGKNITLKDIAELASTSEYEMLTALGSSKRYKKVYI